MLTSLEKTDERKSRADVGNDIDDDVNRKCFPASAPKVRALAKDATSSTPERTAEVALDGLTPPDVLVALKSLAPPDVLVVLDGLTPPDVLVALEGLAPADMYMASIEDFLTPDGERKLIVDSRAPEKENKPKEYR